MDFLAFIAMVPKLVALFYEIFTWIKTITTDDPGAFISECHAVFTGVKAAKTPEEKIAAAGKIQDLIRKL